MTKERLFLLNPQTGRISIACNQRVRSGISALSHHNLIRRRCEFVVETDYGNIFYIERSAVEHVEWLSGQYYYRVYNRHRLVNGQVQNEEYS
jgi:hypothetical protein